jgi:hypothetical protein
MLAHIPDLPANPGDDPDKAVRAFVGQLDPHDLSPRQQVAHAITQTMLKVRGKIGEKSYAQMMFAHRHQAKSEWAKELVLNSVAIAWIDEAEAPLLIVLRDPTATPGLRSIAAWRLIQHQRAKRYDEVLALADRDARLRPALVERLLMRPEDEPVNLLTVLLAVETLDAMTDSTDQSLLASTMGEYLGSSAPDFPSLNSTGSREIPAAVQQWWTHHRAEYEPRAMQIRAKLPTAMPWPTTRP